MPAGRILHLFSTFAIGGPQARAAQLVGGLGDGWRHLIVPLDSRDEAAGLLPEGERWQLVDAPPLDMPLPLRLRRCRRFISETAPDLVCTYNWGAIEWALANRFLSLAPHLHFEDGFGPEESGTRQIPRRVWFRRLALGGRMRIVVPSRVLHRLATDRWRLPEGNIRQIANGIDLARFSPDRRATVAAVLPPAAPGAITVISVGALRPEKNYPLLIEAVARAARMPGTPALRLVLVGEGGQAEALEAAARRAGIAEAVHLAGNLAAPETALLAADIFALSSITEQMPISLVEAMGCALPVCATDVGDIAAMLPEAARDFVTPSGDAAALARSIAVLARDSARRRALGEANRAQAAACYDARKMIEIYASLIDEMVSHRRGA